MNALAMVAQRAPDQRDALPVEPYEAAPVDEQDHLRKVVAYFEESEDGGREARQRSERCRDYYNNIQLSTEEIAALKKRGQPPIYVNYIQRKVDTLCGIERRSRTDPKAFPRNPDDEEASEAATESLRYVADQNKFNAVRSEVYNDILVEGCGGADVIVEEMPNGDLMVVTRRVPWDRIVYDIHSRQLDFSDVKYKGIVLWMDANDAKDQYPDFVDSINDTLSTSASETYDDRPRYGIWCDSKRKRVRIVQMHYKEGDDWYVCTFTKGGFLEPPEVSPYKDKFGRSCSSLHLRAAYADRENNRYGHVEGLIPLQDEINKRRSKSLHLLSQRQTYGNDTAVIDTTKTKIELAKPDGHVRLNAGAVFGKDFGVIPTNDMAAGQIQLMQQALAEMNATGANAAMQGKDTQAQSGVALQTKIQAGSVELEPLADGLRMWTNEIFEAMWMRVRQFWTEEKWIRVTDDDRNVKFVGLNKKVTVGDQVARMAPEMQAAWMQQHQMQPGDPRLQQPATDAQGQPIVENDVSGLDVDIVIEEGPDLSTLQGEVFESLSKLAQGGIAIPPKAIIEVAPIPADKKKKILDEMEKGGLPPEVQKQMSEMQQQLQQLQQENQTLKQDGSLKQAELQLKGRELDIKEAEASQTTPTDPLAGEQAGADLDYKRAQTAKTMADAEKVRVDTLAQQHTLGEQGIATETDAATGQAKPSTLEMIAQALNSLAQAQAMHAEATTRPKTVVRDEAGRVVGIQ